MLIKTSSFNLTKLAILTCGLSLGVQAQPSLEQATDRPALEQPFTDAETQTIQQAQEKITDLIGSPLPFAEQLAPVYAANQFSPLWQDQRALNQFLQEYSLLVLSGVSKQSTQNLEQITQAEEGSLAYDILVSNAFLDYLYYSKQLRTSAQQWLYAPNAYRAKAPKAKDIEQWLAAVKQGNATEFVQSLAGSNHLYRQTRDYVIQQIKLLTEQAGEPQLEIKATLRPGDVSAEIPTLAKILKAQGLLAGELNGEYYNEELVAAVKKLQHQHGLAADGIVGSATRMVLNKPTGKALLYKLALNAQRLKVVGDFQEGLYVNIPSYQLTYYRQGEKVLSSRVIVGTQARKTPVMYSELSNLVVNPPWNAPIRLINEDIIPKVRQDPSYIYRNGYTIIDSKGRSIDPYTIDWENMTSKKFPYRLRQRPGDDSALGRYKFNMPSSDAIYLHDTPRRDLFARKNRALSSGCVRVEKSDELATILLNEAGWSTERKQKTLNSQQTTSVAIKSKHPVYLYYVTAWIDKDKPHYLPDIYNYDVTPNLETINWTLIRKFLL